MSTKNTPATLPNAMSGCILEEEAALSLAELCGICHTPAETMIKLIDQGIITPLEGSNSRQWRFHRSTLIRADKALRLKRDLGVNYAGAALALELLDELEYMRTQLKHLYQRLD